MICCPSPVDSQVCTTPSSELATVTASMPRDGQDEQPHVLVGERVVDDGADEEGLGQGDGGRRHDEGHHHGDGGAVRAEQGRRPGERGTGDSASCWRSARVGFMAPRPPRPPGDGAGGLRVLSNGRTTFRFVLGWSSGEVYW